MTPQGRPRRPCAEAGHFCTIRFEVVLQWCNTSGSESMPGSGAMPQVMAKSDWLRKKSQFDPASHHGFLRLVSTKLVILIYQRIFLMGFWGLVRICKKFPPLMEAPLKVTAGASGRGGISY